MKRFNFSIGLHRWCRGVMLSLFLVLMAVPCWGSALFSPETRELYVSVLQVEKMGVFEATLLLDNENPFDFYLLAIDPTTNASATAGTLDRVTGSIQIPAIEVLLEQNRKQFYRAELMLFTASPPQYRLTKLEQFGDIIEVPHDTRLTFPGMATIDGVGEVPYNPSDVKSVRSDLYKAGYFSLFDLLVHFADLGIIELTYHYDPTINSGISHITELTYHILSYPFTLYPTPYTELITSWSGNKVPIFLRRFLM